MTLELDCPMQRRLLEGEARFHPDEGQDACDVAVLKLVELLGGRRIPSRS